MQGFAAMVQEQLGLSEAELASLQGVMQSFREDRQLLGRAKADLRLNLRGAESGGGTQEGARALLEEMVRLQEWELDLYRQEQAELLTVLNPVQLVQFYRIRGELGMRIQRLRGGGGPGGPGGPGGTTGGAGGMDGFVGWEDFLPGVR
jgi:hypothetical protein